MVDCNCDQPLSFNGSIKCENCGGIRQDIIAEMNRYRCSKCGKMMAMGQRQHDLVNHRYG